MIKQIEITVSVSGKIPRRQFENYNPHYSVKEIIETNGEVMTDEQRIERLKTIKAQLDDLFNRDRENIKTEELKEIFGNLRFTKGPDGRMYPHVTDILYWDTEFYVKEDELSQYGCRGTAIHSMIGNWVKTGKWDLDFIHDKDKIILKKGSLALWDTLGEINFLGFMEKFGKDIKFEENEVKIWNIKDFYTGTLDMIGEYKGIKTVFDFKCREAKEMDFCQVSAYSKSDDKRVKDVKQMVIIPLNSKNKSGFGNPVVSEDIDKYYEEFLRYRRDYKEKFSI